MKKILAVQITILVILAGGLTGLMFNTNIYEDVQSSIVEVLCLSCIKLQKKTTVDYTFDTANGKPHPDFILENLSKGPIFLHYSKDACPACDEILPTIQNFFNATFQKEQQFYKQIKIKNTTVNYIYIYIDNSSIPENMRNSWRYYDKEHVNGFPMFIVITEEYHHSGDIRPYYATIYGAFKDSEQERNDFLMALLKENIGMYNRNRIAK
ncbi:MAG: hypothetical protein V5A64_05460 [Candidatus Thermoplasmatota archaeon]